MAPLGDRDPKNFSKFQVFRNIDILYINRIVVEHWLTIYNFEVTKIIFYPPMTSSQWSLNFLKMQIFCEIYTYYTSIELFLNTDCQFITFKLRKLFYPHMTSSHWPLNFVKIQFFSKYDKLYINQIVFEHWLTIFKF